jgi:hypothetical protein
MQRTLNYRYKEGHKSKIADDNLLGKNLNTIMKYTEALLVTSTEAYLEGNMEKHEQNAEKVIT